MTAEPVADLEAPCGVVVVGLVVVGGTVVVGAVVVGRGAVVVDRGAEVVGRGAVVVDRGAVVVVCGLVVVVDALLLVGGNVVRTEGAVVLVDVLGVVVDEPVGRRDAAVPPTDVVEEPFTPEDAGAIPKVNGADLVWKVSTPASPATVAAMTTGALLIGSSPSGS